MCKHEFKDEGFKWDQKTGRLIQTLKCSLCGKKSTGWTVPGSIIQSDCTVEDAVDILKNEGYMDV